MQGNDIGQMPTFDQKVKNKAQAQSDFRLQQAVMNAPQQADPNKVVNQVSAQSAAENANQAAQQQQTNINSQLNENNQALQKQQFDNEQQKQKNQVELMENKRQNDNRLADVDTELKNRLVDQQMKFTEVNGKATINREQQMADYLISKQASEEEWQKFKLAAETGHARKMNVLRNSHATIRQQLDNNLQELVRDYGREKVEELKALEKQLNDKLKAEQEKGDALGMVVGMGKMVVGGAMLYTGNPMGATMMVDGAMGVNDSYGNGEF